MRTQLQPVDLDMAPSSMRLRRLLRMRWWLFKLRDLKKTDLEMVH